MARLVKSSTDPTREWQQRETKVISPAYGWYTDLVVDRAQGSYLQTSDGRKILDFGCGSGVTSLGHGNPKVAQAVREQLDKLWHISVSARTPSMIEAAELLTSVTPAGLDQVFWANSGAEAVEAALKLARRATGRSEIIAFRGGFHGRTYGALTLTASNAKYHIGMGPFLPGVHHVPYPYCLHTCSHDPTQPCPIANGEPIKQLFADLVPPQDVAAIIVEPVLGEGGYVVPPKEFLPNLRSLCDQHGILLILDEIQTGIGRTGKMFACQHDDVVPDILCTSKALANGLPISAMVAKKEIMQAWHPGEHGTTFGGNPVACAATIAVIKIISGEGFLDRVEALGQRIVERANGWQENFASLAQVRSLGLMVGMEFMDSNNRPDPNLVAAIRGMALDSGLLVLSCGTADNVVRLIPPLNISDEELTSGLDILEASLKTAGA